MTELHVIPCDDLVEHIAAEDCVCLPKPLPEKLDDGSVGWIYVHSALDGRAPG